MTEEQVHDLFDWERRAKTQGTDGETGSGVALLLCKDMAERIDARIEVESAVGRGTTFTLMLATSGAPD
jgi:signal transduction histidine kinase